jgi:hypothetical protein
MEGHLFRKDTYFLYERYVKFRNIIRISTQSQLKIRKVSAWNFQVIGSSVSGKFSYQNNMFELSKIFLSMKIGETHCRMF